MSSQSPVIFFLIVLLTSGVCFGQTVEKVVEVNQARLDELRARGYDALYNLDYEAARENFREMAKLFPDHPAGPQSLAATLWLQELNRSRHLQASLYSAESFSTKSEDRVDPRTVDQFRQWTKAAKLLAQTRLRRNPRDVEALYFLGAIQGLKSVFAAGVERRFVAALSEGSDAADRHREVLKLDPNFHDAELTIGMYDYIAGSLPLPMKLLASISGVRGSKKRGLATLERVAKDGRWARDIARLLLIDLYKREKRWTAAYELSRDLAKRYPRNYFFQLQAADALVARAASPQQKDGTLSPAAATDQREAFSIFESLLHERARLRNAGKDAAADLIHFRYGEALLIAGQPERATKEYLAAAGAVGAEPGLATIARLRAAQSLDLAGRRREALAEYRAVLERPKVLQSHEEARRGLREVYRKVIHFPNK